MKKSQLNQDLNVLEFFNYKKNLFFVDIGANDGITLSNTFLLEKEYNWNGICSEPLPSAYEKLRNCRSTFCDDNAIFDKSNLSLEFIEANLFSGIVEYISEKQKNKLKKSNKIKVNTITLQDLLQKYDSPKIINYLSLDTEGTELKILKSVNLSEYIFLYINVEHNYIESNRSEIKKFLESNGYLYKGENKWDDDYIHESIIIGSYCLNKDKTKQIKIEKVNTNKFKITSNFADTNDEGIYKNSLLCLNKFGNGKVHYEYIKFNDDNVWYKCEWLCSNLVDNFNY
jgi:FkbM family methyltransferase